ncbi:MAG TPA: hypothetical protein VGK29_08915 [Paludibaculum sp.]
MNRTILIGILAISSTIWAQDAAKGHWTGSIEVPNNTMAIEVDLDKSANGWIGSLAIPSQGATGLPLEAIAFQNGKWTFRIKGVPGEPTFAGSISEDGKAMTGDFTQGPGVMPFKLTRSGEPKVETPKTSPAVAIEFTGVWEGTLEAGQSLRLRLKITNAGSGATATLTSVDQGGAEIPVSAITQKDAKLTLEVKAVNGGYEAELNKESTELTGTWSQNGNAIPLKLKKAAN